MVYLRLIYFFFNHFIKKKNQNKLLLKAIPCSKFISRCILFFSPPCTYLFKDGKCSLLLPCAGWLGGDRVSNSTSPGA